MLPCAVIVEAVNTGLATRNIEVVEDRETRVVIVRTETLAPEPGTLATEVTVLRLSPLTICPVNAEPTLFVVLLTTAESSVIDVEAAGRCTIAPLTSQSPAVREIDVIVVAVPVVCATADPAATPE